MKCLNRIKRHLLYLLGISFEVQDFNSKRKNLLQDRRISKHQNADKLHELTVDFLIEYKHKPLFFFNGADMISVFLFKIWEGFGTYYSTDDFFRNLTVVDLFTADNFYRSCSHWPTSLDKEKELFKKVTKKLNN
ncbi:hypothetical protein HOD96_01260 [Candidatus Falkowbacteria bacterium]|jgi:hypothetical protein|nr:hypothetical protein [Candidatus Falkowbacteria bacterium]MBT4433034.1 hypothetical protein [Candidatus Falkowbacteria bacterium]